MATSQTVLAHQNTSDRIETMFEELLRALSGATEEERRHVP